MYHTGYTDCLLAGSGWSSILILLASSQHNLFDLYLLLFIHYETADDGQKTCSRHADYIPKINLRN